MSRFTLINLVNGGVSPMVRVRGLRATDPLPSTIIFPAEDCNHEHRASA